MLPSSLLLEVDIDEGAQGVSHERPRTVGGDEIALVGDVVDIQRNAPRPRLIANHRIADHIGRNRVLIRYVAERHVLKVQTGANLKTGNSRDGKTIGGPEIGEIGRHALRMIADRRDALGIVGDDCILRSHVCQNVPLIRYFCVQRRLDTLRPLTIEDDCFDAIEGGGRSNVVARDREGGGVQDDGVIEH